MVHEGKQLSLSQPDLTCYAGEWRRPYNDLREQRVGGGHKASLFTGRLHIVKATYM